jgi:acetyl-CoA acetyltransferase
MREAVIVSTARTPIGKAFRGELNNIKSPTLMGHAIRHAVARSGVEGTEVEDVVIGTALGGGTAAKQIVCLKEFQGSERLSTMNYRLQVTPFEILAQCPRSCANRPDF